MAIYSLNLKSIGRTTHAPGTAGAHLLYIARDGARPELVSQHMPTDPNEARAWMNRAELSDRKNARVIDKVRIALPRELSSEQRMQLVQDFAQDLTGNRVAWFAAIHAEGKDAHNPHCHLVIRDRDIETGKRVLRLSDSPRDRSKAGLESKAVEWVRAKWEIHANAALERAGHEARIDRRSLEAQGIDREPTIHIGPQAAHVEEFVTRPQSKIKETGQGRVIDYPGIDEGRTRKDRHAEIVDLNLEKATRSKDFRIRETAKMQRQQKALDDAVEKQLILEARARTQEYRKLKAAYRSELTEIRQAQKAERRDLNALLRKDWASKRASLAERHRSEREALAQGQGRLGARVLRLIDVTGRTRQKQASEHQELKDRHKEERQELVAAHKRHRSAHTAPMDARHLTMQRELKAAHAPALARQAVENRTAEQKADRKRQARAAEREAAEKKLDQNIAKVEKMFKAQARDRDRDRGRGFEIG
ncbi:MobA/MobL family protein [Dinoroseobacter sp. S76]|uniref:MobA/MobL family protein n=1 Tax=Dinoroseobacter sp. S76 TaxID=3415124 RepID=UPI003C7B233A